MFFLRKYWAESPLSGRTGNLPVAPRSDRKVFLEEVLSRMRLSGPHPIWRLKLFKVYDLDRKVWARASDTAVTGTLYQGPAA